MKLKRLPADFEVEERTDVRPEPQGEFALYRLTKEGIGTFEAVDAIARRWDLAPARLSFGGLKDRHARTAQHLTIFQGPRRDLTQQSIELRYLGQVSRAFGPKDVRGNRFRVVLRSLSRTEEAAALAALREVEREGLPNYFDDQRFGSLGQSGEFVAQPWTKGDWEHTLWLAFAEPGPMDRPREREEKRILRDGWGDFARVKERLPRGHRRSVVTFLADRPGDFKGALAIVRPEMRGLWLSAFQSRLYNAILAVAVHEIVAPERIIDLPLKGGLVTFWHGLTDDECARLGELVLPLPSSRLKPEEGYAKDVTERTLAAMGLTLRDVNVKHPRGSFFSKGFRPAVFRPGDLEHSAGPDEMYPGKRLLDLRFDLPRGTYATILVKRLTVAAR